MTLIVNEYPSLFYDGKVSPLWVLPFLEQTGHSD